MLDGGGTAAITAPDPTQPAVLIRAKDITVRAFTITGGLGGVIITQGGRDSSTAISSATLAFTGSARVN